MTVNDMPVTAKEREQRFREVFRQMLDAFHAENN